MEESRGRLAAIAFALEDAPFLGGLVVMRSIISFFLGRVIKGLEANRRRGECEAWPS